MKKQQRELEAGSGPERQLQGPLVVLASSSPRREQLLADAGLSFRIRVPDVDETLDEESLKDPPEAAKKLAERKAGAVVQMLLAEGCHGMVTVIGADTMVVCGEEVFGKPKSLSDAKRMLRRLSGGPHEVITAVSVWRMLSLEQGRVSIGRRSFVERAAVFFRDLDDEEIAEYLRQGESFDKAGAYAVQGAGAQLVERVEGDLDTVIGLPVRRLLQEFPDLKPSQG